MTDQEQQETAPGLDLISSEGLSQWRKVLARRTEGRAVALLVIVSTVALVMEPTVFTSYSVTLGRLALVGLVALGLTAVILMGELDLAVASTLAFAGVVMASFDNLAVGIVAALVAGLVIGVINAFFVVVVGINSFIATLGTLFFLRGAAFVVSGGEPVRLVARDAALSFSGPLIGPITPRILLFVAAFIALQIFVTRFRAGREFYAVGGNREAAYDAGIPVRRRIFTGFMISGFVAALAGVINTLILTTADPTAGGSILLASFAAAIIGGVLLTGGRGSIVGTLLGAASLAILQVGMAFAGVQTEIQDILIGAILFLAVISDPTTLRAVVTSAKAFFRSSSEAQPQAG